MFIILGGLPGTGKTTFAREISRHLNAMHLRVDSIEQAIRDTQGGEIADQGYRVAYAIARDNLVLGRTVIADSVNPISITRAAFREVAQSVGVRFVEVEIVCSDVRVHKRRVESRSTDIANLILPTWNSITSREYEPWAATLTIDTACKTVGECAKYFRDQRDAVD